MALTPAQQATLRKLKERFAYWEHPLEVLEPVPLRKKNLQEKLSQYVTPIVNKKVGLKCPECNTGDQIYRKNRSTGNMFIGCTRFPICRWTTNLPDNKKYKE